MKNILKSTLFLSILLVIIIYMGKIFTPKDNTLESGMNEVRANGILGEKDYIDVIIIGDSLTYSSFIPIEMYKEYGFTSYVMGTHAQRSHDTYKLLKNALNYQKPKVVVLETNLLFRKYSFNRDMLSKLETILPFFDYHNRWKNLSFKDFTSEINYTYTDPTKGYMLKKSVKSGKTYNYMKKDSKVTHIVNGNYVYLEKIKKLCSENNIKLILVSASSERNYNFSKHESIEKYATKNKIDYIDLNLEDVKIDWEKDTTDKGDHLNYLGALKESKFFGNILKDKYNLVDKRGTLESWDKLEMVYNKKAR